MPLNCGGGLFLPNISSVKNTILLMWRGSDTTFLYPAPNNVSCCPSPLRFFPFPSTWFVSVSFANFFLCCRIVLLRILCWFLLCYRHPSLPIRIIVEFGMRPFLLRESSFFWLAFLLFFSWYLDSAIFSGMLKPSEGGWFWEGLVLNGDRSAQRHTKSS